MGKTLRWFKGLFGLKKKSNSGEQKDKVWSCSCIGRSLRNPITPVKRANNDQNQRAITATITSSPDKQAAAYNNDQNQCATNADAFTSQNAAAIKIQSHFRAYLAKKALKALKSLVKFQAVVRGFLVRKQILLTLNQIKVLFIARSIVYEHKFRLQNHSAAIKIQSHFRAYLCKKALKALKSLVKFQALVRGFLVRKQIHETLNRMEALFIARSHVYDAQQDDKFLSRSKSVRKTGSRRNSYCYQIPINVRRPKFVDMEPNNVSRSRLTWADTWAWAAESNARDPHRLSVPSHFFTKYNTSGFAYTCGPNMYNEDEFYTGKPSYMWTTESFRCKSARPDGGLGIKERVSYPEVKRMEKSFIENGSFKNSVMRKMGKSKVYRG